MSINSSISILLFVLGAFVGSFLNVVALRFGKKTFVSGRSECPHCHKALSWWELVPVFSFLFLRGKCSNCKAPISWQYPLVELWTALIFATMPRASIISLILLLITFSIYIIISLIDFRTTYIPDKLSYLAMIVAIVYRFVERGTLLDWLAGPILFLFFGSIWYFSKGRAMGFGDAKLALSLGLILGITKGLTGLALSFWIGTIVAVSIMIYQRMSLSQDGKRITMKSEIPFGPFLVIGGWLALILSFDLLHVTYF